MPQNARRRTSRPSSSYRSTGVIHDNLARELNWQEQRLAENGQQQYRRAEETAADQRSRQRRSVRMTVRKAQPIPIASVMGGAAIAVLAVLVISCQVKINAISDSIVTMKKEISELEIAQIALQTQYEQAFDLATVKESAEAMGMQQPVEGQIIYIDLPGEDQAIVCREENASIFSRMAAALKEQMCALVEYFR